MLKKMTKTKKKVSIWKEAEDFLSKDKMVGPLIEKYGPCTIKPSKSGEYFRDIVYSIVGQQLSMKAADSIYERIVKMFDGGVDEKKILLAKERDLRNCGLSYAKIKYIKDFSEKVKTGDVRIHEMERLSDEEIAKELIAVKGIGRWTIDMFLMFSLARPDVFPIGDLGIRNSVKKLYNTVAYNRIISNKGIAWKPYRTVASWYLWSSLDNK